ncbi:hypothetical protein NECAME_14144 [Necator americanus]|uniref:Uncharacterized protein n=1 Tax=Necator americanus TaxID=51031 RepID=W2SPT2_NECAM|nr:hypothetical protein NECAME_14144 [Necator americanus]ETN71655.1 hypothetical protein NECAME_14144 [Necator americanus]
MTSIFREERDNHLAGSRPHLRPYHARPAWSSTKPVNRNSPKNPSKVEHRTWRLALTSPFALFFDLKA